MSGHQVFSCWQSPCCKEKDLMGAGEVVSKFVFIDQISEDPSILQCHSIGLKLSRTVRANPFFSHPVLKPSNSLSYLCQFVPGSFHAKSIRITR